MRLKNVIILALLFASLSSNLLAAGPKSEEIYSQLETFSNTIAEIKANYVKEVKPEKLMKGALEGMLSSLDDYSQFMDPEIYKEMQVETKGRFGGLGIVIAVKEGILTVIAPMEGTPAYKAGIKPGDRIVKIEGESTKKMTLYEAVKRLRGPSGTTVKITIMREGEKEFLEFTLARAIVEVQSVKEPTLDKEKIGYIRLVEFQEKTAGMLREEIMKLKSQGMAGLVLDLRNNPGGLLISAVEVAEIFVPEKKIVVSTQGRKKDQNIQYLSHGGIGDGLPLAVLINPGSASASEIVAGAIQDWHLGVIVGTKSFGKGSVQTIIPLSDGNALRLTTAYYLTPAGRSINGEGIKPDVSIELSRELENRLAELHLKVEEKDKEGLPLWWQEDIQLQQALNILKANLIMKLAEK